jgi:hypothetical protein
MEAVDECYIHNAVWRILQSNRPRRWKRRAAMFYMLRSSYQIGLSRFHSW